MKTIGMALFAAVVALGFSSARGDDKKADASSDLKALDAKLTDAFKARDVKTLDEYTADDFTEVDPSGHVRTKKEFLEHLAKGTAKIDELKESDVHVRDFGKTAVVTGLLHLKATVEKNDIGGEYRWTRVYNKKGDKWLCVYEQHTFVTPKEKKEK